MRPRLPSRAARLAAALVGLSGCADHTDITGTFADEASVSYRREGGAAIVVKLPHEPVVVKTTERHYQFSTVEVTVRGCVLRSSRTGETNWGLTGRDGGKCKLDVPSIGPVEIAAMGSIDRVPPSRTSKPAVVHVTLHGSGASGETVDLELDAKPQK